jgi:membrane protease YdiL (CAAX protease family)
MIEPPAGVAPRPDSFAARLRGFGPVGILAMFVVVFVGNGAVPLGALLVLGWAYITGTPWRALGFTRPRSRVLTVLGGILLGGGFKVAAKALVMPLFHADPVNHAYHYLAGNTAALPGAIWTMIVAAGFGEETVYRGYLFERFGRLFRARAGARAATVLIVTTVFAAGHYLDQGIPGVEQAFVTGLLFGVLRASGVGLPFLMVTHAAFDLTAVAMIYADLESKFAHLVFR